MSMFKSAERRCFEPQWHSAEAMFWTRDLLKSEAKTSMSPLVASCSKRINHSSQNCTFFAVLLYKFHKESCRRHYSSSESVDPQVLLWSWSGLATLCYLQLSCCVQSVMSGLRCWGVPVEQLFQAIMKNGMATKGHLSSGSSLSIISVLRFSHRCLFCAPVPLLSHTSNAPLAWSLLMTRFCMLQ